jgi:hypothetical protein
MPQEQSDQAKLPARARARAAGPVTCTATTVAGHPCTAPARPGRSSCWSHADDVPAEVKSAARRRGGTARAHQILALKTQVAELHEPVQMQSPEDVSKILEDTVSKVRSGALPPRVGSVIAQLANAALKSFELDVLRRLQELEKASEQHPDSSINVRLRR